MEFSETLVFSYELLMGHLAETLLKQLTGKVKRKLQGLDRESNMMMSSEDSNLRNVWDEFCVQVQGEQSFFYDSYLDVIESIIAELLANCTEDEKIILWTQTQEYEEWSESPDNDELDFTDVLKMNYDEIAVCEYVLHEVENMACNYSTARIDKYLYSWE